MRRRLPILLLLTTGCYSYTAVTPTSVTPGRDVRVTLGDLGSASLAQLVGPRAASLDGRLLSASDSAVSMSVTQVTRDNGVEESWNGESVLIPRSTVASFGARKLSTARSVGLGAGIAAASLFIARYVVGNEGILSGGGRPGTGGPPR